MDSLPFCSSLTAKETFFSFSCGSASHLTALKLMVHLCCKTASWAGIKTKDATCSALRDQSSSSWAIHTVASLDLVVALFSLFFCFFLFLSGPCQNCEWPMPELFTKASCRRDWKRILAESSVKFIPLQSPPLQPPPPMSQPVKELKCARACVRACVRVCAHDNFFFQF